MVNVKPKEKVRVNARENRKKGGKKVNVIAPRVSSPLSIDCGGVSGSPSPNALVANVDENRGEDYQGVFLNDDENRGVESGGIESRGRGRREAHVLNDFHVVEVAHDGDMAASSGATAAKGGGVVKNARAGHGDDGGNEHRGDEPRHCLVDGEFVMEGNHGNPLIGSLPNLGQYSNSNVKNGGGRHQGVGFSDGCGWWFVFGFGCIGCECDFGLGWTTWAEWD